MKKLCWLILVSFSVTCFSQELDLIVMNNGDSIACRLDSITSGQIYLKMKYNDRWIHTHLGRNECKEFRYNFIPRDLVVFRGGSSYIKELKGNIDSLKRYSVINKNTFYGTAGFFLIWGTIQGNYERLLWRPDKGFIKSLWGRAGAGGWVTWGATGTFYSIGATMLTGSRNNHIEFNLGLSNLIQRHSYIIYYEFPSIWPTNPESEGPYNKSLIPMAGAGYRFQRPDGTFLFRGGISVPESVYLSLGFCF